MENPDATPFARLYLKRREERRVRQGHPWVFSNEVDVDRTPLSGFAPGQAVEIADYRGKPLGVGYVNPQSLICVRVLSTKGGESFGSQFWAARLQQALSLRERLFDGNCFYRLAFGESDGLPGLVVDRYADTVVAQIGTAGVERRHDQVVAALECLLQPRAIVLRNDHPSRALEGLDVGVRTVRGQAPDLVRVPEHGLIFDVSPLRGQKTGWYFDHRFNRARVHAYVRDQRVLDVFSYCGAWGLQAAAAGAREVLCVDSSETALEQLACNAHLNGLQRRVSTHCGDAFATLKALYDEREQFDTVILDPPAFVRRKKDLASGLQAYHRLHRLALRLLSPDGILVSACCSSHLRREQLLEVLASAARGLGRTIQIVEEGHQAPDHPVHPMIPESSYLKVFFARLLSR
jgi:23S rRNA (cytosine1962-C5)-methyltransferase